MENQSYGKNVRVHPTAIVYPNVVLNENVFVGPYCIIGEPSGAYYKDPDGYKPKITEIGANSVIRSHNVIYEDVHIGENFQSGHHVTIREDSVLGNNCSVGTLSDIQGKVRIGNFVRMHSNVHIGMLTTIKDYVWIFPYSVVTNDLYPPMDRLTGCTIEEYALITTGSILLPGVKVGKNAMVAAGAVVSKDVEEEALVMGVPAKQRGLVTDIRDENGEAVYPWKDHMEEDRGYPWQKTR